MKPNLFLIVFLCALSAFTEEIKFKSIEDIKKCGANYSWDTGVCFSAFEKFVSDNPKQALPAAKIGRTVFAQWAVLPTFDKAFQKSKSTDICKDVDFQLSLFNSLGQPDDNESYKLAQKYLKNECGPHLVEMAMKELDSYSGSSVIENLCPLLKSNGKHHKTCDPKPVAVEKETPKETLPKLAKDKIKLGTKKAYRGPEGMTVLVAEVQNQKDIYLVTFRGIKGPWNNKTFIHKANNVNTTGSMDYWTEHNGSTWNSILVRNCNGGYCQMEVYAPENSTNGLAISYDEKATKLVKNEDLLRGL